MRSDRECSPVWTASMGLEPSSVFVGSDRSGQREDIGSDERQAIGPGQRLLLAYRPGAVRTHEHQSRRIGAAVARHEQLRSELTNRAKGATAQAAAPSCTSVRGRCQHRDTRQLYNRLWVTSSDRARPFDPPARLAEPAAIRGQGAPLTQASPDQGDHDRETQKSNACGHRRMQVRRIRCAPRAEGRLRNSSGRFSYEQ